MRHISIVVLIILALLFSARFTGAQELTCPQNMIQQLTDFSSGETFYGVLNPAGTFIAFESLSNIDGNNPEENDEVYLLNSLTGVITQITEEPSGTSTDPAINSGATRVAFRSSADIDGGNPEGNFEIYYYDTATGVTTQVTDDPVRSSFSPWLDGSGNLLVFSSRSDVTGSNPDNSLEVFLLDIGLGLISQITDATEGSSTSTRISADGSRIVFSSTSDFDGGNPEENREIFYADTDTGIITQVTHSVSGDSFQPFINADGSIIVFRSVANIGGLNPGGLSQIYLYDAGTDSVFLVTDTSSENFDPVTNPNGTFIAFSSNTNVTGENPDGSFEIFVIDLEGGTVTQVTKEPSGMSFLPSLDSAGDLVLFFSDSDINGGNPDGNFEMFLAVCLFNGGGNGGGGGCALADSGAAQGWPWLLLAPALFVLAFRIYRRMSARVQ